ncbi:DCL3B [Symbiodinium microadriaticum]|nr:DCL3B [Symbiodinium microadriaticum]
MFNKRSLAAEDVQAVAPAKRFRSEMVDIFLNNELSSERSARVLRSAQEAGAQHVEGPETRNTHRDLLRKCFRNTKWSSLYHTKVRGWNQANNSSEEYSLAILLPHESLHSLLKVNTAEALLQEQAEILPAKNFHSELLSLNFEPTGAVTQMYPVISSMSSSFARGHNKRIRCAKLCQNIKAYYDRAGVTDRLPKLLPTMIREEDRGKIKSPKLRAKAGEARALVGAALELATKYSSPANPAEEAMLHGTEALQSMYACLSTAAWDKATSRVQATAVADEAFGAGKAGVAAAGRSHSKPLAGPWSGLQDSRVQRRGWLQVSAKSAAAGDGEGLVRIDIFPSIVGVEEYQLLVAQSLLPLLTPQDAVSDMVSSEGNMMMPGVDLFTRFSAELTSSRVTGSRWRIPAGDPLNPDEPEDESGGPNPQAMCLTDFPAAVARAKALRNIRAMSRLRRYQEALAAEVLRPGNHVIHLQTGAGKTLIAFHLILEALERHRGKLVYFLAPTVPLVRQQHEDFQTEVRAKSLSIQAGILAGGRRTNLGRCHVVFATPGSVREDIVGGHLSTISLVVLDEVHHVVAKRGNGGHDYSHIAESVEQTSRLLQRLEAQLVQVPEELGAELRQQVPSAVLVKEAVACSEAFRAFMVAAETRRKELQRVQSALSPESSEFFQVTTQMKRVAELAAHVRCFGWDPTAFPEIEMPEVPAELKPRWDQLVKHSRFGLSPCFDCLLSLLQQPDSGEFRCIVFVETRNTARNMVRALRSVAARRAELGWLLPTCLVGHNKRCAEEEDTMTIAQQTEILENFRQGNANVMVATSVAEEGIDIPCCNVVVRLEPARTVIKFIQEERLLAEVEARGSALQQQLRSLSPSPAAVNCWSTPGPAALEPILAFDPAARARKDFPSGLRVKLEEMVVDIDTLMPTQATVRKTFSDGRCVLETMVRLVQRPDDIPKLPLVWVCKGRAKLLGRRSPVSDPAKEIWLSADNRRCFLLKVIAPLCDHHRVRVVRMEWTDEIDAKLKQCPQTDAWATDLKSIERVRQEVLDRLTGVERPLKCQKHVDSKGFNANEDYVSKLNLHMQKQSRPHAKQSVADYEELPRSSGCHIGSFSYRVLVKNRVFHGDPQPKVKAAKQAAAYDTPQLKDAVLFVIDASSKESCHSARTPNRCYLTAVTHRG